MSLEWKGDKVIRKMDNSIIQGMSQTITDSVDYAKANHPWHNRTTTLEGSIREVVHPHKEGDGFVGVWGSVDVDYALILELGSLGRAGIPPYPYLRPAADAVYPRLPANIRNSFEGRKSLLRDGRVIARPI